MTDWPTADDPRWLEFHFERAWPWLDAALKASPLPTHAKADVWAGLQSGSLELWPTPDSACLIQIVDYPTGVRVLHGLMAGGKLTEIKGTVERLEAYAKERGCDYAAPQGREGWLRALPGYQRAYTVMCKRLVA